MTSGTKPRVQRRAPTRPGDRWGEDALLKGTYYLATAGSGTHSIVAGYERFAESRLSNNFQSGSNFFLYISTRPPEREADGSLRPIVSAGDIIKYAPIEILSEGSDLVTESLFVNDKWDLGAKWSFNIGGRYDRNDAVDSAGHPISKDSNVSPRIGAIYDIRGDGHFRMNASYSKYVSKVWEVAGGGNGGGNPAYITYEYRGPTVGGRGTGLGAFDVLEEVFRWYLAQGGTNASELVLEARVPGYNVRVDELDSPGVDEWTLGFGMQLGQKGVVRIDFINREWGDFYASFTSPGDVVENPIIEGEFLDVVTVGNTDHVERSYRGLVLQATYRPTGRVFAGGNYTWSRSRGNDEDIGRNDVHSRDPFVYAEYKDFAQFNPVRFITNDQTHRARIWLGYDQALGRFGEANFSILESYDSGRPYSAQGNVAIRPYVANPGYATPPVQVSYYFSKRGEYRWEAATSTDLAINYDLPIRKAGMFVQGEILNLFDEQAQIAGNASVKTLARFNPFTETPKECPQGQGDCAGFNWQKGASFGTAIQPGHYQNPRTYRFSAGLRF